MLQINLIPVNLTPDSKKSKKRINNESYIDTDSTGRLSKYNSSSYSSYNNDGVSSVERTRQRIFKNSQLTPSQTFALSEIYYRYQSGENSKRLALYSITRQSYISPDSIGVGGKKSTYSTQVESIGSSTFYLDASGEVKAKAFAYIRRLYNETGLKEMTLSDYLEHYGCYTNLNEIQKTLSIHGYTIDQKNYPHPFGEKIITERCAGSDYVPLCLNMASKSLGLRAFAHLSQHLSKPNCTISTLNLSNNHCPDVAGSVLASSLSLNTTIRTFILSNNLIGSSTLYTLCTSMSKSPNLPIQHLELININLSKGSSIDAIGHLIRTSPYLKYLDLSKNGMCNVSSGCNSGSNIKYILVVLISLFFFIFF
jgi:hypothetical protein